jgi:ABC-type phosphate/phosphonate transport system substrate-binding protein
MMAKKITCIKRLPILAFVPVLALAAWGKEPAPPKGEQTVRFALSSSVIEADVNPDDAIAATKIWASNLGRGADTWTESDATIFRNIYSLMRSVNNEEIDIIALASNEYVELEGKLQAEPALVYVQAGQVELEYVIIVHRDSGIKTLADLKGKRIVIAKGGRNVLVPIWLNSLLLDNNLPAKELFMREIKEVSKTSQVVLPVFFKQMDAGVVTKSALETTAALNPQIGQQVKIIATSPPLVPQITCFRASLPAATKASYVQRALNLHLAPYGLQTFNVFKLERLLEWKPRYLDNVKALMRKQKHNASILPGQNTAAAQASERAQ